MNPGTGEEQVFPLGLGRTTIGRTKDNGVVCIHKSLSRAHAALEFDGRRVRVLDLDSKNGVFVRGKRVRTVELGDGDTFRCGDVNFLLESGAPESQGDLVGSSEPKMSAVAQTLPSPLALDAIKRSSKMPPPAVVAADDGARYREKLAALIRGSELLASSAPLERLLEELAGLGAQVLEIDRLALLTLDEETLEMTPRVLKSFVSVVGAPFSRRVVDWVVDGGAPGAFEDVSHDETLPGDGRADRHIRSAMAVPIDPGAGTVGVLYVDSTSEVDAFGPDDLALLRAIANLAAVGIELAIFRRDSA